MELGEEQASEPQQTVHGSTSDGEDLGSSVARRGARGRSVVTTGSFVMSVSNRAGNDEEEE